MAQLMAAAIVLLVIFLMLYGYRLMRNYNKELLYLAYHDALTGAENMSRFRQKLIETLKTGRGSVAAFTIRQFPFLTEIFGKEKSDQLLRQIREIADRHITAEEFFCRDAEDRFYLFSKTQRKISYADVWRLSSVKLKKPQFLTGPIINWPSTAA